MRLIGVRNKEIRVGQRAPVASVAPVGRARCHARDFRYPISRLPAKMADWPAGISFDTA